MSAPQYLMGTQAFGGAWNENNISELVSHLNGANIKYYDTARLYPLSDPGASERLLGSVKQSDSVIDTKILYRPEALREYNIEESLYQSLENLGVKSVNVLYAHAPDSSTPIADQAANLDALYRKGLFNKLGLCNYSITELREWYEIATEKDYVKPTVFQGQYNIFCRQYEKEVFPFRRENGIQFIANSPLAGGFATGNLTLAKDDEQLEGTRFEQSPGNMMGYLFRSWYDKPDFHDAVRKLIPLAEQHGVSSLTQASLRWLLFHSGLKSSDGVAIGPSKIAHLRSYLQARSDGPLPEILADEMNKVYDPLREQAAPLVEVGWWSM